jgi:hypothetical protein
MIIPTESGITTEVKRVHDSKAYAPITNSEGGNSTDVKPVHPTKAALAIDFNEGGNVSAIDPTLNMNKKALTPMVVTPSRMSTAIILSRCLHHGGLVSGDLQEKLGISPSPSMVSSPSSNHQQRSPIFSFVMLILILSL